MFRISSALGRASFLVLLSAAAVAEAATPEGPTSENPEPAVFPPHTTRKSKRKAAEVPPAPVPAAVESPADSPIEEIPAEGPAVDAPAIEPPAEGVWHWVEQMDGEIPTAEQVDALEESAERTVAERRLSDELSSSGPPTTFYTDPVRSLRPDPLYLDRVDPSEFDIPIEINEEVVKWIRYFTGDGRKYYAKWLTRSTIYRPYMYEQLEKAGLPRDLVYLSMIESGYNAHALSHAGAAGMWQFMPATGKMYKLRIDYWVDERRDIEKSTRAAIDMLGELHQMFDGSWYLAWASYNGGPGRVRRSVQSSGTENFWTIAQGAWLHPETENYVPKIIAAAIIGHHPERYGFDNIEYQPTLEYDVAHVSGSVSLEVLARAAGTSVTILQDLNPALRRYSTPAEGFDLKIPAGGQSRFVAALATIPREERSTTTVARHTVRRGETLSVIAGKYNVSLGDLSQANGLRNVNRIYVGMSLVIPGRGEIAAEATPTERKAPVAAAATRSSTPKTAAKYHTVARGDTLSEIASKYGVSVTQLKSWNKVSGSTIVPGQKLAVNSSGGTGSSGSSSSSSSGSTTKYTVKKGDTLSTIAAKYGVTTAQIQSWNGIKNASSIYAGQVLSVKGSSTSAAAASSGWTTYTVKSGDSLGAIAQRHGCTVTELQSWNGIRGSVIQPGQKLKLKS
ncbi:MAG: LysM peptidoglycan-binding domain-containing protein [Deltaproteobacteria bacterium]|nr:LysM peptidoglycan-binding domain-containing protein [Deltaproteobacteria bacterium]